MKVFVPMDERGQPLQTVAAKTAQDFVNRRRYTRHRLSARVEIGREQGLDLDAMMLN